MAESIDFNCSVGDVFCVAGEGLSNWMTGAIKDLSDFALSTSEFNPNSGLWAASIAQTETWLGLSILVMVITAAVGITWGLISMQPHLVKRALIGAVAAVPATMFALFIVGQGLIVIDEISHGIVTNLVGADGLNAQVQTLVDSGAARYQLAEGVEGTDVTFSVPFPASGALGSEVTLTDVTLPKLLEFRELLRATNALVGGLGSAGLSDSIFDPYLVVADAGTSSGLLVIFLGILLIGMLLLAASFSFRTFVLMLLVAFAPLAFVLMPTTGGSAWVRRWASAVVAMALAKPLMLGALVLLFSAFGTVPSVGDPTVLPLLIGVVLVGLMPLAAFSLFSFIGAGAGGDDIGSRAGGAAISKASSARRSGSQLVSRFVRPRGSGTSGGSAGAPGAPGRPVPPVAPQQRSGNPDGTPSGPRHSSAGASGTSRPAPPPAATPQAPAPPNRAGTP